MKERSQPDKKIVPNHRLRQERERRGWAHQDVADRIGLPDPHTVSRWERGTSFPSPRYRRELCRVFEKDADALGLVKNKPHKEGEQNVASKESAAFSPVSPTGGKAQQDSARNIPKPEAIWNVPISLTSLVGREQEVAAICTLLQHAETRLLTLLGTAGIGKTRLGLQVAIEMRNHFADGVCFVPLASISDSELVMPTIAQELGIQEIGAQPVLEQVKVFLREKHLLLLLDNFEQVVTMAPQVEELLAACLHMKVLVTSRAVLHVQGEQEFSVPPLALPDLKQFQGPELLSRCAAVALFVQRAQAILPTFHLTEANARALAEICVRLDGLPLAIELAAARSKLLPPQALLARLTQRLQVLTSGTRALPERQQTLRSTLKWSYDLLNAQEQQLFRRLSVFVGGCTLKAVEVMYTTPGGNAAQVLDRVASLMDMSMLQQTEQEGEEPRLLLLETIREYGLERLAASGEMEAIQRAHAAYYLALAEEAEPELKGPREDMWLERLEREHDNLRAALRWAVEQGETGHSMEMALRFGGALQLFWFVRDYATEGRQWLERALVRSEGVAASVRGKALNAAGMLAVKQNDYDRAKTLCGESLVLFRDLGNKQGIAFALFVLGSVAMYRGTEDARPLFEEALALFREVGDKEFIAWSIFRLAQLESEYDKAYARFEESLALFREQGNKFGIARSLSMLAKVLFLSQGDQSALRSLLEESLAMARELDDKSGIADRLYRLGRLALNQNDIATARSLAEESLIIFRKVGEKTGIASSLTLLARVTAVQGDYIAARALYEESLALAREVEYNWHIASCLEGVAYVVAALASVEISARRASDNALANILWAVQLWGAAEVLRETMKDPIPPIERAAYERSVAAAYTQLGEEAFVVAWAEGRAMTLEQVLAAHGSNAIPTPVSTALQQRLRQRRYPSILLN